MKIYVMAMKVYLLSLTVLTATTTTTTTTAAIISGSLLLATAGIFLPPVYAQNSHQNNEVGNDDGSTTPSTHRIEDSMNMNMMNMTTNEETLDTPTQPPFLFNDTTSDMQVKVSWEPISINTKVPTKFTFEFFNSNTGDRLSDITYSLHLLLDGKGLEHGHETSAPEGIGTFVRTFEAKGSLSIMIESIKVAKVPTDAVVQLSIPVVAS